MPKTRSRRARDRAPSEVVKAESRAETDSELGRVETSGIKMRPVATKPGSLVAPLHPSTRATNQPRRPAGASRARDIHLLHVFVAADTTAAASDLMNNPDAPSRAQVRRPLPALTTKRDKTLGWSCQEDARARTRELSGGFARAHAPFNDASTRAEPFGDVSRAHPRTPRPSRTP